MTSSQWLRKSIQIYNAAKQANHELAIWNLKQGECLFTVNIIDWWYLLGIIQSYDYMTF